MNERMLKIARNFATGKFGLMYDDMSSDIHWRMVGGANGFTGKDAVVAYCEKMMTDMQGSTPVITNEFVSGNQGVIEGYFEYKSEDGSKGVVDFCDVYVFENEKLKKVTSYVVERKMDC
jgi:uncharacterized protein